MIDDPEQAVDRRLLSRIEGEIRILDVARDEPGALEGAADPLGYPLHQPLQLAGARGRDRNEHETAFPGPAIHPVEHEQVKVHVEIERTAEALYQGHGARHRARAGQARLADQVP